MSTSADSQQKIFDLMGKALLHALPFAPQAQLIENLRMVVERITFSDLATSSAESIDTGEALIESLFARDQPRAMIVFVKWVLRRGYISMLSGDNGYGFITHVSNELSRFKEIEFLTAVKLPQKMQIEVSEQVHKVHGEDSRIVFITVPSLMAGFVVRYPDGKDDFSLSGSASGLIQQFIITTQPQYDAGRGEMITS
jgi:F0F1-type ATP synthase delta subunit